MHITRDELKAAIDEAHSAGLKVTGHLCSVTYPEAIALGIDDLEHGFMVNTDGAKDKQPGRLPAQPELRLHRQGGAGRREARALIDSLVAHKVAITSTLARLRARRSPTVRP
jgi:imidazolonepropionase-like amidohydrolase